MAGCFLPISKRSTCYESSEWHFCIIIPVWKKGETESERYYKTFLGRCKQILTDFSSLLFSLDLKNLNLKHNKNERNFFKKNPSFISFLFFFFISCLLQFWLSPTALGILIICSRGVEGTYRSLRLKMDLFKKSCLFSSLQVHCCASLGCSPVSTYIQGVFLKKTYKYLYMEQQAKGMTRSVCKD